MTREFEITLSNFNSCFYKLSTRNSCVPHHFLSGFFFVVWEILRRVVFFATIVKRNGLNNCIKSFPFSIYKEKQVSLLVASPTDSIFSSQKNHIKRKTFFPVVLQTLKNSLIFLERQYLQHTVFEKTHWLQLLIIIIIIFSRTFFYHAINLQVAHIIQFWKNKKCNKTNTNKTQNLLKVIFRF